MKLRTPLLAALVAVACAEAPAASPPPSALDILEASVGFRTEAGSGQVPAYAAWLREQLLAGGFDGDDVQLEPLGEHGAATATLTARYRGKDPARPPLLLIAHMDVVPARREDWKRDPFTATRDGAYLYGRGVKDNKFDLSAMLAAVLRLKRAGFRPGPDVVLAFTGDEETTGEGARRLAARHGNAGLVLNGDSGGGRLDDAGGRPLTYSVQGGEKTYVDYTLTVTDPGGHSSRPTGSNAIYRLADALTRLAGHRFPVQENELTTAFFAASAPVTPGQRGEWMRRYVADPKDEAAIAGLSSQADLVGLLRTTCVATQVAAGHAPNALPQRAVANVNCRLFPGTTAASVQQTLQQVVADPAVSVTYDPDSVHESAASPLRKDVMSAVSRAVHATYPDLPIVPTMSPGATDGRYFRALGIPTYGVSGLFIRAADDFAHGLDERIPLAAIEPAVAHWESLIHQLAR